MSALGGPAAITVDYSAIPPEDLIVTCVEDGKEAAWVEFVKRFHPLIASVVLRVARQWGQPSVSVVEELVQETYLKLCSGQFAALRSFKSVHPDSIFGYLRVFTANLAHDHFKIACSQKRGAGKVISSLDDSNVSQQISIPRPALDGSERSVLMREIDECLESVASGTNSERDRRMFRLYYRAGMTASAIAALPGIDLTTKGVEATLLRLVRQIRERLVSQEISSGIGRANAGIGSEDSL
jgi:RNA polymerase sigma-70 factor, ECF subfamily